MFLLRILAVISGIAVLMCSDVNAADKISISVGDGSSPLVRLSLSETRRYFSAVFTNRIQMSESVHEPDIVLGTPDSNPLVKEAVSAGKLVLPIGKNSDQGYALKTIGKTIYVAGHTDQGVLYGLYELLERYGVYYQISGERLPDKSAFTVKNLDICVSPIFKYRGLLPWDNFLCGMSGYNFSDYKDLVDRAARMKLNMIQFHFYSGMAFFTEEWKGKPIAPTCIGMPVDVFRPKGTVGAAAFKGDGIFGSKPYVDHIGNPRKQAEAVQSMMRKVIDYSHTRGFTTCVGFELMSPAYGDFTLTDKPSDGNGGMNLINPLDAHNVDLSVKRLRDLMQTYPKSDYYWMWQSEARGFLSRNVGRESGAAEMRKKYAYWTKESPVWGGNVPGGDIDYAYLFREVVTRLTSGERSRIATGGWNVEHLFPGIDRDFPREITFASLNSFVPDTAIDYQIEDYRVAKDGRPAWMIDWWEFDGEQWFPQFRAGWQEKMYRRCADFGVEGVTLLGWKLSGIEHNIRYLSEFSWNPQLTAKDFYAEYVSKVYGPKSKALANIYDAYDAAANRNPSSSPTPFAPEFMYLSPGWSALVLLPLPGMTSGLDDPTWRATVVDNAPKYLTAVERLRETDRQAISALNKELPDMHEQGKAYAAMMINRFEVRDLYLQSLEEIVRAQMRYDEIGREQGIGAARKAILKQIDNAADLMGKCVQKYSEVICNRGDQGVVAQMTEQYYNPIKQYGDALTDKSAKYATLDWTAFRLHPTITFDFSGNPPWGFRDGKVGITTCMVDGRPTLVLEIGGDGTPFHSAVIYNGSIDLKTTPFLDFRIRTTSQEPLAIMFQVEGRSGEWEALNIIGKETLYPSRDALIFGAVNDGAWHRVTWDLKRLASEQFGSGQFKISNLIVGSWEKFSLPIVVEFQSFALGKRNTLD